MTNQLTESQPDNPVENYIRDFLADVPAGAMPTVLDNLANWAEAMTVIVDATTRALEVRAGALDGLEEWPQQRAAWAETTSVWLEQLACLTALMCRRDALIAHNDVLTGAELSQRLEGKGA